MEKNVLESMPEDEILLDEEVEIHIDLKMLTSELLKQFEQRCKEKLNLSEEKDFEKAVMSLKKILSDINQEKIRRSSS